VVTSESLIKAGVGRVSNLKGTKHRDRFLLLSFMRKLFGGAISDHLWVEGPVLTDVSSERLVSEVNL